MDRDPPTPSPLPKYSSLFAPRSQEEDSICAIASPGRRRSSRVARQAVSAVPKAPVSLTQLGSQEHTPGSPIRRTPKRKASEVAANNVSLKLPDDLLEEALRPLTVEDIREWEGWVELESEPAFFNIILRDLGVKDVKAQEIFSIDQGSLDFLPQPVYGLIFLFQYGPDGDESEGEDDTGSLWFANQTTNNACATVALLNIVMNAGDVHLGGELRAFKAATQHLGTALRGHELSRNQFIRTIHNSFTRRMDHLNSDLALENEASTAEAAAAKRRAGRGRARAKAASKRSRQPSPDEYGYHFIAYVPADGFVWELDGLKSNPKRIDCIDSQETWTTIARPRIEDRIMRYEGSQLSFNLLALCQSPLAMHSRAIAQALAALLQLQRHIAQRPDLADLLAKTSASTSTSTSTSASASASAASSAPTSVSSPTAGLKDEEIKKVDGPFSFLARMNDDQHLAEFNLSKTDIEDASNHSCFSQDTFLNPQTGDPESERKAVLDLHDRLVVDAKSAMGEFRAEMMSMADDELRVKGRKKDYGRSLHKWVQKLAEKNVLEEVIRQSCS